MTPVLCRVKDDPDNGSYGDCVRACVASILNMDGDAVPHFFHDNCSGRVGNDRIAAFLRPLGFAPFLVNYPGDITRDDILDMMAVMNSNVYYMLFGRTENGDHVVVCKGGKQVHNPSWIGSPLIAAGEHGFWTVMVIARS